MSSRSTEQSLTAASTAISPPRPTPAGPTGCSRSQSSRSSSSPIRPGKMPPTPPSLYTSNVDGFCIVSSDSDFTRLASRLRESGKIVIGMGEKKTPDSFRAACTIFTELENLLENEITSNGTDKEAIEADIVNIITLNDNKGKLTGSGEIGSKLQNKYPDFDIRSFGYSQLSKFLEDIQK